MTRQDPTAIALVPVKERSVRYPGKNFAKFMDTTLLSHAVKKLNIIPHITQIIISTDAGKKVANTLQDDRTDVEKVTILERPPHLCDDITTTDAVVHHVISRQITMDPDEIMVVTQVTSPLWYPSDLINALVDFVNEKRQTTVTVNPEYQPTGCFYIFRKQAFMMYHRIYAGKVFLWTLPYERSLDIDYPFQLPVAEAVERRDYSDAHGP